MRDSLIFYSSFSKAIKMLPEDEQLKALWSIIDYGLEGKEPSGEGLYLIAYEMAKPQIDANIKRKSDGTKGGRPKTSGYENKKPVVLEDENYSYENEKPNVNVKVKENVNVKAKEKENVKEKGKKTYTCAFEELWSAYPRKKDKGMAYKQYMARLNSGFSEDELMTAVKRYASECQRQKTEERYIKHCSTFLGPNTPFVDYLKEENNDTGGKTEGSKGYIQRFIEAGGRVEFDGF